MRPGITIHPKFRRLVYLLGIPQPYVAGLLEFLWKVAYENGDPVIGDAVDVELAAQWPGEQEAFCRAAIEVGFLDDLSGGLLAIHDLFDHAPDYVLKRLDKEAERRRRGEERKHAFAPRSRAMTSATRAKAAEEALRRPNSELGNLNPIKAELGGTPARAPAPVLNTPLPPTGGARRTRKRQTASPEEEATAARVVEHYQATVQPGHGKEGGANNVASLLREGLTEARLCGCADAYAADCRTKKTEAKYRVKVRNFYGRAGGFKDYIDRQVAPSAAPTAAEAARQSERELWAREKKESEEFGGLAGFAEMARRERQGGEKS